jgi:hypothetical protein
MLRQQGTVVYGDRKPPACFDPGYSVVLSDRRHLWRRAGMEKKDMERAVAEERGKNRLAGILSTK